ITAGPRGEKIALLFPGRLFPWWSGRGKLRACPLPKAGGGRPMVQVGDCGWTGSSLHPQGFVRINEMRYDARSEWNPIEKGSEIVVLGGDLQGLIVRQVAPGLVPERMPNYGKPAPSSFGELLELQQRRDLAEREQWQAGLPRWRAARRAYGLRMGALLG